jgi:SHS2 domain-containing protein
MAMKRNYRYLDHTADLGIEVWGENLVELFTNIGKAIFETQIHGRIKTTIKKTIVIHSESLQDLFIDWCRELLYTFSVSHFIPRLYEISINNNSLQAHLKGDIFDPKRHRVKLEIKNPTYHDLKLVAREGECYARIIFDV